MVAFGDKDQAARRYFTAELVSPRRNKIQPMVSHV